MADNIVPFKSDPPLAWWHCNCGCATFYVRNDGELECAQCDKVVVGNGHWRIPPGGSTPRREIEGEDPPVVRVKSADEGDTLDDTLRFIDPKGTAAMVVVQESGTVHTWGGPFEGRAQRGWLRRRLEEARRLLAKQPLR